MCLVRCSPRHTYLVDLEKGLALAVHDPHNGDVVAEPACVVREDGHADFVHLDSRNVPAHLEDVVEVHDLDDIEGTVSVNRDALGIMRADGMTISDAVHWIIDHPCPCCVAEGRR